MWLLFFFDFSLDPMRYLADPATGLVSPQARAHMEDAFACRIHEQRGLVLKSGRVPASVPVVDHLEKTPVDN